MTCHLQCDINCQTLEIHYYSLQTLFTCQYSPTERFCHSTYLKAIKKLSRDNIDINDQTDDIDAEHFSPHRL